MLALKWTYLLVVLMSNAVHNITLAVGASQTKLHYHRQRTSEQTRLDHCDTDAMTARSPSYYHVGGHRVALVREVHRAVVYLSPTPLLPLSYFSSALVSACLLPQPSPTLPLVLIISFPVCPQGLETRHRPTFSPGLSPDYCD